MEWSLDCCHPQNVPPVRASMCPAGLCIMDGVPWFGHRPHAHLRKVHLWWSEWSSLRHSQLIVESMLVVPCWVDLQHIFSEFNTNQTLPPFMDLHLRRSSSSWLASLSPDVCTTTHQTVFPQSKSILMEISVPQRWGHSQSECWENDVPQPCWVLEFCLSLPLITFAPGENECCVDCQPGGWMAKMPSVGGPRRHIEYYFYKTANCLPHELCFYKTPVKP